MTLVRGILIVWRLEGVQMCRVALMQLGTGENQRASTGINTSWHYRPQYILLFLYYIALILLMESSINSYLEEITAYLNENSLLIFAPKYSVTLFSPDTHQAKTHPRILIEDSQLPLE